MKLVTFDLGNSNPNVGLFENGKLKHVIPFQNYNPEENEVKIVCSVKKQTLNFKYFDLNFNKKNNQFFDMTFNYADTVGIDRLVASYYAFKKFSGKTLVIDAGTFITIDIVDENGFQGGYIFPGINTFLKSYLSGENLSQFEFKINDLTNLPHTTQDAIVDACQIYLLNSIENIIKKASPSRIILTGGSFEIIEKLLAKINLKIEIQKDCYLLHHSMQLIHSLHLKDLVEL